MFKRIMVPVDLTHADKLDKALTCAADLATHYEATLVYVGVTTETPSSVAHTPTEFADKLDALPPSRRLSAALATEGHTMTSHDPTVDLDDTLMQAVGETGADLVVMASHIPNVMDHIWPSNGGSLAAHAKVSVMVVR